MGYSMPGDKEIYSLEEIIREFDPKRIGVSGAFFDIHKLDWINQQYLINTISARSALGEDERVDLQRCFHEKADAALPYPHQDIWRIHGALLFLLRQSSRIIRKSCFALRAAERKNRDDAASDHLEHG